VKNKNIILKLRIKLIIVSMLATLTVLSLIMTGINFINYQKISNDADATLAYLIEHYGQEDIKPEPPPDNKGGGPAEFEMGISPEVYFESRYFVVMFDESGNITEKDTANIFAITDNQVEKYGKKIYKASKESGFYKTYRYKKFEYENRTAVMFLDSFKSISNMRFFLFAGIAVSLVGFIAVFIIVLLLSNKIVEPISKSYEKQKQFITDAGHEIKTPLAVIQADIDVLSMSVEANEWIDDIKLQLKRLSGLTDALIRLSKLDEGRSEMEFSDFSISELALDISDSFLKIASAKGKRIIVNVEDGINFRGEAESISRLFSILLDNAIKYSSGEVINFDLKKQNANVIITTINEAENISEEAAQRLFERFYRVDSSRVRQSGGTGLRTFNS